ncbi:MAG: hypothetical protein SGI90_05160 [Candidatus Eisenbacteria bacterium]|nr:hypothetical protein [Candidatus Eisenbacteria bacterium]
MPRSCSMSVFAPILTLLFLATVPPPDLCAHDVLETDDLRLIYTDATLGWLAPYTARCYENSMAFHKRLWGYKPSEKVTVIMDDFGDYSNAGVWVGPRNSMVLHVAPANNVFETGPSNERINFTMNHEAVHVVALDQGSGSDIFFRDLFAGKIRETDEFPESILWSHLTLPRRSAPRWYHEGIAVFFETWMAGGYGRAQGPYDEMVFRSMVRDSTRIYDPLGLESEGTRIDFQVGVNSYLYGTRFMSWLALEYGPETLVRWVGRAPGSKADYRAQFRQVYDRSLDDAWRDWIRFEKQFQAANLDSLRRYPTTQVRDLTDRALGSVSPTCYEAATRTLYVAVQYPGTVAHIAAIEIDSGRSRRLLDVKGPALYFVSSLALDDSTRTLFYTTDNNDWRDLCALDLATGKSRRILKDIRIGDLAFNSVDRSLWGVRHFNALSSLVRLEAPYDEFRLISSWPYGQDLYDLDVSPDGKWLSASHAEISGRQSLRLFDMTRLAAGDTTSIELHDFGAAIPTSFVFSPDTRFLFGSSYYTGVSNIWRYDLAADSMEIVSNAETGFFRPRAVADDSLLVFRYSGEGFVPAWIAPRALTDVSPITFLGERIADRHPIVRSWAIPPPTRVPLDSLTIYQGEYRPLRHLGLANWYPIVQGYKDYTGVGARLEFSDPLSVNTIGVSASYASGGILPENERLHLGVEWTRSNIEAAFHLNKADFYDLFGPTKTSRKGRALSLRWTKNLIYDSPRNMEMKAGAAWFSGLERHPLYQNVPTSPNFSQLLSGWVRLDDKNQRSSIGAADTEKGYRWQALALVNSVRLESTSGDIRWKTNPQFVGGLELGTPILIPNSSVWLRTAAGWSPGEEDDPFANFFFGGFGNNWVDHGDPKRYREIESFPGIDLNAAGGTNFTKAMLDWNLPALRFRRVGVPSFYASWIRGSIFAGGLWTNLDRDDSSTRALDVGTQVDLRMTVLSRHNLTLSFGYARALVEDQADDEEYMVSLKIL